MCIKTIRCFYFLNDNYFLIKMQNSFEICLLYIFLQRFIIELKYCPFFFPFLLQIISFFLFFDFYNVIIIFLFFLIIKFFISTVLIRKTTMTQIYTGTHKDYNILFYLKIVSKFQVRCILCEFYLDCQTKREEKRAHVKYRT